MSRWRAGEQSRYWMVSAPKHPNARNGGVLEHRLVMEQKIGRYLSTDEVVHHRNGDPGDNRLENLELLTKAEHARRHLAEELRRKPLSHRRAPAIRIERACDHCGGSFEAVGKKEQGRRFCSQPCYWSYRRGRGPLRKGVAA